MVDAHLILDELEAMKDFKMISKSILKNNPLSIIKLQRTSKSLDL